MCVLVLFVSSADGWLGESLGDLALHQSCMFLIFFLVRQKSKAGT